jgi:uncharacterized protein
MHPIIPLLQLVHSLKRIEGRKKLQKMVHILKELGAPFSEPFEYSFYGMYSLQLRKEVTVLESEQLVRENEQPAPCNNTTFVLESTSELDKLIADFELTNPPEWIEQARKLNDWTPQELEGVSTILFLQRTERNPEAVRNRLLALKPRLADVVDTCMEYASGLRKVA